MMKKNYVVGMGLLLIGLLVLLSGCNNDDITGKVVYEDKPIKLGLQVGPASTLHFVANDKGFFEQEGLSSRGNSTSKRFRIARFLS